MNKLDNEANAVAVDSLLNFETVSAASSCIVLGFDVDSDSNDNGGDRNTELPYIRLDCITLLR